MESPYNRELISFVGSAKNVTIGGFILYGLALASDQDPEIGGRITESAGIFAATKFLLEDEELKIYYYDDGTGKSVYNHVSYMLRINLNVWIQIADPPPPGFFFDPPQLSVQYGLQGVALKYSVKYCKF